MKSQKSAREKFVSDLERQWPREIASSPQNAHVHSYINVSAAMQEVKRLSKIWSDNSRFYSYVDQISRKLTAQAVIPAMPLQFPIQPVERALAHGNEQHFTWSGVFDLAGPAPTMSGNSLFIGENERPAGPHIHLVERPDDPSKVFAQKSLRYLCDNLGFMAHSKSEKAYVSAVRSSCKALAAFEKDRNTFIAQISKDTLEMLQEHLRECQMYLGMLTTLLTATVKSDPASVRSLAFDVQHAPRLTPTFWLRNLSNERFESLSEAWKAAIVDYAGAITQLHRAKRMVAVHNKPEALAHEMEHIGHTNWSPFEFPETLLLEAESGVLIRPAQETVAQQMRSPPGYTSSCVQMNMGEGKSSIIIPMVSAALSDKEKLVRVKVAKPQSQQMLQTLITRLGGLLNRRIYHLPFRRDLRLSISEAESIQALCKEARNNRGIILAQPEHILSFKLMGIEALINADSKLSTCLLETQVFLDESVFDIVDEADENFNPKFELVYTMGTQQIVDFAPQRWLIIQEVLGLIAKYAPAVKAAYPLSISIEQNVHGSFPRMKISNDTAMHHLLRFITKHIVTYGLTGLTTRAVMTADGKNPVEDYMSRSILSPEQISAVENSNTFTDSCKYAIWLVRGLTACGILRFCLMRKRWRVDFGLDRDRDSGSLLAVPYRFKDGPSPRSEFSHPDVLIILTLLSHYYGGLSNDQMFMAFGHLFNSDQAAIYFNEWVNNAASSLPSACRTLGGINIKDRQYCIEYVFPHLRYSKACIDYFLSRLVFPKELRQFTSKISASGWDLAALKKHPITSFSGMKDMAPLLPLSVKQQNLPSQEHVNALVLGALLNTSSVEILSERMSETDAENVLQTTIRLDPEIRVLLDCGAAILEQNNRQVASAWLRLSDTNQVHAAVYFEDETLSVLDRVGRVEPFQTSPFAKQLDVCVVYLDEVHTRGIDLKLPIHYRACLTLGQSLTKDKLIQGSMRMRQLGKGQSVTFLVPPEIVIKICELTSKDIEDEIEVKDVLLWSMGETWKNLKTCIPLWATQGERYLAKQHLYHGAETTQDQALRSLEDEMQSLESRYRPGLHGNKLTARVEAWDQSDENIRTIMQRAEEFGAMNLTSCGDFEEEQERELAPEKEEHREVERPLKLDAANHAVHKHVEHLVLHGKIQPGLSAFQPAFQSLGKTTAAGMCDISKFSEDLLVTTDFARTVILPTSPAKTCSDLYQRTVQWVLSVPNEKDTRVIKKLVILSPHEANILMPRIRKSDKVTLHMFAPRTNVNYAPLDHLDLYNNGRAFTPSSVPRTLTMQLNLFAGSLYLRSYDEYRELCDFLGLLHADLKPGQTVSTDGFIKPPSGSWGFVESPVPFLRTLLTKIRCDGDGVEKTHLGKILSGVRLEEADFRQDVAMSGT